MTTVEQVEKLRAMAQVTYAEARDALAASDGDMLEAIIYLEQQGKVNPPPSNGYYSSQVHNDNSNGDYTGTNQRTNQQGYQDPKASSGGLRNICRWCLKMIRKGNINYFEIHKENASKASFPITVLGILLLCAFWVVVPLLIIGLLLGYQYRFFGPNFTASAMGATANNLMDEAYNTVNDLKKNMCTNNDK